MSEQLNQPGNEHMELYKQMNSREKIDGIYLQASLEFPCIVFECKQTLKPHTLVLMKNTLPLGKGDHVLYYRDGNNLRKFGTVPYNIEFLHGLDRILKNYDHRFIHMTSEIKQEVSVNDLLHTIELGKQWANYD